MRIAELVTDDLDDATRAQIIRVCVVAHDEPDFENLFRYVPSGGHHWVAYEGEALVSHAMVTTRWLQVGGRRLETAYVDAVATHPAHQGRGIGSAVMERLAAGISRFDIGCLGTERPGFYERLGWERWRGPLAGLKGSELTPTPDERGRILVLRLGRSRDVDIDASLLIEWDGRIW